MHYGGVISRASRAADLNENAVRRILHEPGHRPELETIDKLAQTFGWSLYDAVLWRLNRTPPTPPTDPAQAVAHILAAANYREGDREFITELVARCAPARARVSSTE